MDIRVEGITKDFGRTGALRGVDLAIRNGELIALLGPSGSGKTTLLRIIAGLETPKAGRVYFDNENATGVPVQKRKIGFVFQQYALFKHMSVFENIAYGLRVRPSADRPNDAQIAARVHELLELIQLPGLDGRYPAQLSGGQRQRVALARALAVDPRVLLLDEPFGALDAKVRRDLRRWLRELHDQTRHTTIFVTHDQEEALELADRVAILNSGKLEQVGTADEVYDHPASAFVMSFVGETMSIPVEFDGGRFLYRGRVLEVPAAANLAGKGRLYMRPGDVELTSASSALSGGIRNVRRTAVGHRIQISLGEEIIEVDVSNGSKLEAGGQVGLRILTGKFFNE